MAVERVVAVVRALPGARRLGYASRCPAREPRTGTGADPSAFRNPGTRQAVPSASVTSTSIGPSPPASGGRRLDRHPDPAPAITVPSFTTLDGAAVSRRMNWRWSSTKMTMTGTVIITMNAKRCSSWAMSPDWTKLMSPSGSVCMPMDCVMIMGNDRRLRRAGGIDPGTTSAFTNPLERSSPAGPAASGSGSSGGSWTTAGRSLRRTCRTPPLSWPSRPSPDVVRVPMDVADGSVRARRAPGGWSVPAGSPSAVSSAGSCGLAPIRRPGYERLEPSSTST